MKKGCVKSLKRIVFNCEKRKTYRKKEREREREREKVRERERE